MAICICVLLLRDSYPAVSEMLRSSTFHDDVPLPHYILCRNLESFSHALSPGYSPGGILTYMADSGVHTAIVCVLT